LRLKGADRAAVELRRFLEAELIRGTKALRGLARIIYVATKVECRSRHQADHRTTDCRDRAVQPAGRGDPPPAPRDNRPIYPTDEEMSERARAEEERLRRLLGEASPRRRIVRALTLFGWTSLSFETLKFVAQTHIRGPQLSDLVLSLCKLRWLR
jgi:hypothetical protein